MAEKPDWRKNLEVIEGKTNLVNYGLEITSGKTYTSSIDLKNAPVEVEETYEGRVSTKFEWQIDLMSMVIRDKLDMAVLARDNPNKYARVVAQVIGPQTLKLTRKQTNDFIKFLRGINQEFVYFNMWRTGTGVKTQYHFTKADQYYKSVSQADVDGDLEDELLGDEDV